MVSKFTLLLNIFIRDVAKVFDINIIAHNNNGERELILMEIKSKQED